MTSASTVERRLSVEDRAFVVDTLARARALRASLAGLLPHLRSGERHAESEMARAIARRQREQAEAHLLAVEADLVTWADLLGEAP